MDRKCGFNLSDVHATGPYSHSFGPCIDTQKNSDTDNDDDDDDDDDTVPSTNTSNRVTSARTETGSRHRTSSDEQRRKPVSDLNTKDCAPRSVASASVVS